MSAFIHLLQVHFAAYTTDPQDRLCLVRVARVRPITGGPIHGWRF